MHLNLTYLFIFKSISDGDVAVAHDVGQREGEQDRDEFRKYSKSEKHVFPKSSERTPIATSYSDSSTVTSFSLFYYRSTCST